MSIPLLHKFGAVSPQLYREAWHLQLQVDRHAGDPFRAAVARWFLFGDPLKKLGKEHARLMGIIEKEFGDG